MNIAELIQNNKAILAPMAGVTDTAFRNMCHNFGSAFSVSEMVSSKALVYKDQKTKSLYDLSNDKGKTAIQIFGDDPLIMAKASEIVAKENPVFIDVNMGCPVPKIAGNNCGSALMKNPKLCGEIVKEMAKAVDLPITVKIRRGIDDTSLNFLEVAKACEDAGASMITIHGRTRVQMYKGKAEHSSATILKRNLSIPVIANGDVIGGETAADVLDQTGADAVMVGRGAMGRPWVFSMINSYLGENMVELPEPPMAKKLLVIREHIGEMCSLKGEEKAMRESRKHLAWYFTGIKGAAELRRRSTTLCKLSELDELLMEVYLRQKQL